MVIAALYPLGLKAQGISAFVNVDSPIQASVKYEVSLPQAQDDIVYNIDFTSDPADAASPTDMPPYIIEWCLNLPDGSQAANGFVANFPDHHYRFRDHRLLEYHRSWDSIPFSTPDGGVQANGQFVDLLPLSLSRQLQNIAADSTFTITPFSTPSAAGTPTRGLEARQRIDGQDCRILRLTVDDLGRPLKLENDYNLGQISEQSVTATYTYPDTQANSLPAPHSEQELIARYPDVFEKYRESNYAVENLRGLPLPAFSEPTTTGERYTHHRGESFPVPTLIAVIDPSVASSSATITSLRKALAQAPRQIDLLLAFVSNNIDQIEAVAGPALAGEHHLLGARSLARSLGVNAYPTLVLAAPDGSVAEVFLGVNKDLPADVIQAASVL